MANSNEYMREYMKRRYHERMAEAHELLGGKCVNCGSTENLEIDHINPSTKSIALNKLWSIAKVRFLAELIKCQLLCKSCHKVKSDNELQVNHGDGKTGKKNCRCSECAPLKNHHNYVGR